MPPIRKSSNGLDDPNADEEMPWMSSLRQKSQSNERPLEGQVALVTGGSRGCGRAIAVELGAAGCTVYVTAPPHGTELGIPAETWALLPTLEAVAAEISDAGGLGIAVECDNGDEHQTAQLFERIHTEQNGRLDILVNNAFDAVPLMLSSMHKRFFELPPVELFDRINRVGTRGHFITLWHAAQLMIPRRSGLIVEIGSPGGVSFLFNTAYGINKSATDRLAQDAAIELREFGITSVALNSGPVRTELFDKDYGMIQKVMDPVVVDLFAKSAESPELQGRCLVAFAADPNRFDRTGHILLTQELAKEYEIRQNDGRQPSNPETDRVLPVVSALNQIRQRNLVV